MSRMKIVDILATNSLVQTAFNKNINIHDKCHLKQLIAAIKIIGATKSTMSEEQILL